MKRNKVCIIIASFFFLVALGITLYPIISTWYNARHQSQLHSQYQEQMQYVDADKLQKEREKAIAYNQSITPGSQQVEHFTQEAINNASEDYKNLLNLSGSGIMGYVQVPSVEIRVLVYVLCAERIYRRIQSMDEAGDSDLLDCLYADVAFVPGTTYVPG